LNESFAFYDVLAIKLRLNLLKLIWTRLILCITCFHIKYSIWIFYDTNLGKNAVQMNWCCCLNELVAFWVIFASQMHINSWKFIWTPLILLLSVYLIRYSVSIFYDAHFAQKLHAYVLKTIKVRSLYELVAFYAILGLINELIAFMCIQMNINDLLPKRADCVLSNFGVTNAHKLVQIHMTLLILSIMCFIIRYSV